jgi:hypothetical protein
MTENKDRLDHQAVGSASGFHAKEQTLVTFLFVFAFVGDGDPERSAAVQST